VSDRLTSADIERARDQLKAAGVQPVVHLHPDDFVRWIDAEPRLLPRLTPEARMFYTERKAFARWGRPRRLLHVRLKWLRYSLPMNRLTDWLWRTYRRTW
jgi:hypothetical protein